MGYIDLCGLRGYLDDFRQNASRDQEVMYCEEDLEFIHKLVRKNKPFTSLEFGTGYSTLTIAHALWLNKIDYDALENRPAIRNSNLFKHHCLDSNKGWLENTKGNFPADLSPFVVFNFSEVQIHALDKLQLCSLYRCLPDIVPEFIYLDGPR